MLNVSERAQRLMYTLYSEELRKAEQPLMHLSDALLAWLSQFYDWKEREKKVVLSALRTRSERELYKKIKAIFTSFEQCGQNGTT